MKIKKLLGQVHLWLGLIIGLLFFVIALSGAIYTWAPEFRRVLYKQAVQPENKPFVSVPVLKNTLSREFPEGDFRTALYKDKASTIEVLLYAPGTYYYAYLNPYSGELVHLQDMKKGWLNMLVPLHRNLLLGDFGRQVVHWVTLLSLIMLVTGLVLWWPASKKGRKQRWAIKWNASPKRLNYDMHNVLGFYATWIAIFTVITGLFWGFEVVRNTLKVGTGESEIQYENPVSDKTATVQPDKFALMDSLAQAFRKKHPSKFVRVSNPHKKTDPIRIVLIEPDMLVYSTDHYYFDRYTGQRLSGNFEYGLHAEASTYNTLHGLVYDVHFGTILGLPGRLLVFFASLIMASLPITGFIVWLGKRKK